MAYTSGKVQAGSRELREVRASCERICSGFGDSRIRKRNLRPLDQGMACTQKSKNKRHKRADLKKANVEAEPATNKDDFKATNNIRKFLECHLLDDVEVTCYPQKPTIRDPSNVGTKGTIEGSEIKCHCQPCKGNKMPPALFEAHAGCKKKHPAENFYVNETVTVKDIMNACKLVPREFWEGKVHDILGTSGLKTQDSFCLSTKESLPSQEPSNVTVERNADIKINGFNGQTIIDCSQCGKECQDGTRKELLEDEQFCSPNCEYICSQLKERVKSGEISLPQDLLKILERKRKKKSSMPSNPRKIKWRLLHPTASDANAESEKWLKDVTSLYKKRFKPMRHGKVTNLIPLMVNGSTCEDLDFSGMYCVVLVVGSVIACAATIRIFGDEVAEIPLAATTTKLARKGYFKVLFSQIEDLLRFLKVKRLILPACHASKKMWTDRFGFKEVTNDELMKYENDYPVMTFLDTTMLHKSIAP